MICCCCLVLLLLIKMTSRKCVISGCGSIFINSDIKRHRIPWNDKTKCKAWIKAILDAGTPHSVLTVNSRLCSLHFNREKKADSIPSVFPRHTQGLFRPDNESGQINTSDNSTQKTPIKCCTVSSITEMEEKPLMIDKCVNCRPSCSNKDTQTTFTPIDITSIKHSDKLIKQHTGLDSYKLFEILHKYLTPYCHDAACNKICHSMQNHPSVKFKFITSTNQFLLVLYKLKTNQNENIIAKEFGISQGSVSAIFKHWIGLMYEKFKLINTDASLQKVRQHTPQHIADKFHNLREIIDATEITCAKPSDPVAQRQLWSNYKHNHTVKVQIGCTPTGAITSVSDTYGGMISDKKLFEKSGRSLILNEGDALMVDKGYLLADILQGTGVRLIRPPFLREAESNQFSEEDRNEGRLIAKTRIVIENVNARMKAFKILQQKIPVTLLNKINEIVFICATLSNFGPPLR